MSSTRAENQVKQQLTEAGEPLDQDRLIELLSKSDEEFEREEIIRALRDLMDKDKVSYNIDWNIQLED